MSVIENLDYRYDDFVLQAQEVEIPDKGVTALVGASGSGKTTFAKILLGLEFCDSGWAWHFKGEDLAKLSPAKRRLGVVFQDYALFPHMTAKENIYFAAQSRKISQPDEFYQKLSTKLNLKEFESRKASVISGGERQRTALARALIGLPRFLILDEPFSALDAELRSEARSLVQETLNDFDIPALLITHDKEDVDSLASKTLQIERGQILDFLS